jgi:hypothetical protein
LAAQVQTQRALRPAVLSLKFGNFAPPSKEATSPPILHGLMVQSKLRHFKMAHGLIAAASSKMHLLRLLARKSAVSLLEI